MNGCTPEQIKVIDIGTGASCIYPLLGASRFGWKFLATDINEESLQEAQRIIDLNDLGSLVSLEKSDGFPQKIDGVFDFSMCNPPFYGGESHLLQVDSLKRRKLHKEKKGIDSELFFAGGEVSFVKKLVQQSIQHKSKVKMFSSMLGLKSSVRAIEKEILNVGAQSIVIKSRPGKTLRWFIFWSFDKLERKPKSIFRSILIPVKETDCLEVINRLKTVLAEMNVHCAIQKNFHVRLNGITWNRAYRKSKSNRILDKILELAIEILQRSNGIFIQIRPLQYNIGSATVLESFQTRLTKAFICEAR